MIAAHGYALGRGDAVLEVVPVEIAVRDQFGDFLFTLKDDGEVGLVLGHFNRAVQQGFVMHHAARFDPARGSDDRLGCRVVDAHGKLVRRKPAEHDRVDRTKAGTGQHRL